MKIDNLLNLPLFDEEISLKHKFSENSFITVMPCLHETSKFSKELFLVFCNFIKNADIDEKIKGSITFTYEDILKYSKDIGSETIATICKENLNLAIGNLASKVYEIHNITVNNIHYDIYKFTLIKYFKEDDRYFIKLDEIAYDFSKNNFKNIKKSP